MSQSAEVAHSTQLPVTHSGLAGSPAQSVASRHSTHPSWRSHCWAGGQSPHGLVPPAPPPPEAEAVPPVPPPPAELPVLEVAPPLALEVDAAPLPPLPGPLEVALELAPAPEVTSS